MTPAEAQRAGWDAYRRGANSSPPDHLTPEAWEAWRAAWHDARDHYERP